jgi:hypothetical protein
MKVFFHLLYNTSIFTNMQVIFQDRLLYSLIVVSSQKEELKKGCKHVPGLSIPNCELDLISNRIYPLLPAHILRDFLLQDCKILVISGVAHKAAPVVSTTISHISICGR